MLLSYPIFIPSTWARKTANVNWKKKKRTWLSHGPCCLLLKPCCQDPGLATLLVASGDLSPLLASQDKCNQSPLHPCSCRQGRRSSPLPNISRDPLSPDAPLMAGTPRFTPTLPKSHLGITLCSARFPGPSPFDRALRGSKWVPDFCPALRRLGELRLPVRGPERADGAWRHHLHLWVCWDPWPAGCGSNRPSARESSPLPQLHWCAGNTTPMLCWERWSQGEVFPRDVSQEG